MRIVCPSCAAAYEVPDARLVPGQPVRCARCGTSWTPVPEPLPASRPPGPLLPPNLPVEPGRAPSPPPRTAAPDVPPFSAPSPFAAAFDRPAASLAGGPAVLAGWVLSIAVVLGLSWAAVTWRHDIMQAWPPSERLYSTLGLQAGR